MLAVYTERAREYGRKYNLSAEELFNDAYNRVLSMEPTSNSTLYGVPISIKDEIYQEMCCSSGGLIWRCSIPDPRESILVSSLRSSGCVPFVRGNAMQMMIWIETTNNIYGTAQNPWDVTRTTGGSSGGDAGLVAIGAAPIAIGSDIGGSIRVPAAFCGVYGFKPSSRRITALDCASVHQKCADPLEFLIKASYGPFGRCVEDLVLILQSWWTEALWHWDFQVKFNHEEYNDPRKLRIGYFTYNNVIECADVVKNIVMNTVEKLRDDGHELIEMDTTLLPQAFEIFARSVFAIEGSYLLESLQGEDPSWPYHREYFETKYPGSSYLFKFLAKFSGFNTVGRILSITKPLSFKELCALQYEISNLKAVFNEYYQSQGFDAIICPIWPLVAPLHQTTFEVIHAISYACVWNVFDFPAGVVPVKLIEPGEDVYHSDINDGFVDVAKKIMKDSVGLPVTIQVIGNTYQDEKVLKVMKIIQDYYRFFENFHYPMIKNAFNR